MDSKLVMEIKAEKRTNEFSRDAMTILSGKYFSRKSMNNIDKILAQSTYYNQENSTGRKDGIVSFFHYTDNQGRGVYFGVAHEPNQGDGTRYYLYSVTDTMEASKRKKH